MEKFKLNTSKKNSASREKEQGKPTLEELRRTLGFPEGTEFLGYAILLKDSHEFLTEFEELAHSVVKKSWTRKPHRAACYKTLSKALEISALCLNSVVVGLFDTGNQIVTVTMSINR